MLPSFRLFNNVPCVPCLQGETGPTGTMGTIFQTKVYNVETNMTGIVEGPTGVITNVGVVDDGNFSVTLPFPVTFLNQIYDTVYIGSNSYLTFGAGSDVFFNIDGFNPPVPGLLINANDNSLQKYYHHLNDDGTKFTVGYLGALNKTGVSIPPLVPGPTPIPPLMWQWEVTFYKDDERIDIVWIPPYVENVNGINGVFKISSGNGTVQNLPKTENGVILTPHIVSYKNIIIEGDGISLIYNNDVRTPPTQELVGNLNIQPLKNITVDTNGSITRLGCNNLLSILNDGDLTLQTTTNDNKCADINFSTLYNSITFNVDDSHNINIYRPRFVILNNTSGLVDTLYIDENRFIRKY